MCFHPSHVTGRPTDGGICQFSLFLPCWLFPTSIFGWVRDGEVTKRGPACSTVVVHTWGEGADSTVSTLVLVHRGEESLGKEKKRKRRGRTGVGSEGQGAHGSASDEAGKERRSNELAGASEGCQGLLPPKLDGTEYKYIHPIGSHTQGSRCQPGSHSSVARACHKWRPMRSSSMGKARRTSQKHLIPVETEPQAFGRHTHHLQHLQPAGMGCDGMDTMGCRRWDATRTTYNVSK